MSDSTAYGSLAAELRDAIARGDYAEGRRLPTEAELSAARGVSRQTVRRALQELVAEGLVYRVRGRGTFAAPQAPGEQYVRSIGSIDELLALSLDTTRETLRPLELRADVNAAGRLRLDGDQLMTALFRRGQDEAWFVVTELFVPLPLGRALQRAGVLTAAGEQDSRTVVGVVDELLPEGVAGAQQSVTAVELPEELAPLLDRPPGTPALRVDRVYVDVHDAPLYLAVNHFNPDRYTYRVQLRRRMAR